MTPVVPRIGNNVSHVTRISYDSHFAWQAQYSVMLEDDTGCSAQESNLLRISSQTNLISYESNLLRISSQTNLISLRPAQVFVKRHEEFSQVIVQSCHAAQSSNTSSK